MVADSLTRDPQLPGIGSKRPAQGVPQKATAETNVKKLIELMKKLQLEVCTAIQSPAEGKVFDE